MQQGGQPVPPASDEYGCEPQERIKWQMVQNQSQSCGQKRWTPGSGKSALLQRHPVLLPLFLLSCASIIGIASFSPESIFPLFSLLGIPAIFPSLSLTLILGITGIVTSIVGVLEWADRFSFKSAMFPHTKEQSYVNRN